VQPQLQAWVDIGASIYIKKTLPSFRHFDPTGQAPLARRSHFRLKIPPKKSSCPGALIRHAAKKFLTIWLHNRAQ
jgi:hypothetical protein